MKSSLYTLLLLCLSCLQTQATDNYRPFIEDGKEWSVINTEGLPWTHLRNYFDGDTVIAGKRCKKWIQEEGVFQSSDIIEYVLYAYEENKRVCFFQEGDTIPRLFFDFGAEIGDTLITQLAYARAFASALRWAEQEGGISGTQQYEDWYTDTLIIVKKQEQMYGERMQKCIWFDYIENGKRQNSNWDFMMEGVGMLTAPYWNSTSQTMFELLTCTVGDKVLFWAFNAEYFGNTRPTSISTPQMINCRSAQSDASHLEKWSNGKCFDLTGRRLAAPPAKGMYIRDGKKMAR